MRKLKLLSLLMLICFSVGNVWAADVTYDFTGSGWTASSGTLSNGTVSFTGAGSANFKMNSGYFIMGKKDAYITFPTYSSAVEKIVVTGRSGASTAVGQNIFVGSDAVSTATTGAAGENTYNIASGYQAAGTTYILKVTTAHNTQITKIEVFYAGATTACATPTFSPAAGAVVSGTEVSISCATDGATIHYTTDGTEPTASSPTYSSAITIDEAKTIKAIAVKGGLDNSSVASAAYTVLTPLTTMDQIFTAAGTAGTTPTQVAITFNNWVVTGVKNSNAYVTDGTKGFIIYTSSHGFQVGDILSGTAVCKVQLYNGSAELTELTASKVTVNTGGSVSPVVLDAEGIAALTGANTGSVIKISGECTYESSKYYIAGVQLYNQLYSFSVSAETNYECTGVYVLNTTYGNEILPRKSDDIEEIVDPGKVATPTFSPEGGEFSEAQNVTITCETEDATIYYTIDGTDPSTTSSVYSSAIEVSETTTIKALAVKAEMTNSDIASATYTITGPQVTFNYADYKGQGSSSGSNYTMVKTDIVSIGDTKFYGNNNQAHFYANGVTTITPAAGITITQIVLTATETSYNGYQSSGTVTASAGSLSHEGKVVTWTGSADAAFTISHDKQIRWISIVVSYEEADPSAPALAVDPTVIDFGDVEQGSTVDAQTVAVNFANLTGEVTYSGLSSPFSATGTISATGDLISISADATVEVGEYEKTLTVTSAADSKSATVTVTMNVVAAASGDVYNKLTGSIEEGDYVIFYNGKALKNTVASSRFGYEEVTPVNNKISDPDASIIWSISQSGEHWTIYNENVSKYAGATGSNNQGALLSEVGDKALWSISGTGEFDITNKYQTDNSKNAYLRNNGTYGFACYAVGTGGKLILYKAANSKSPAGIAYAATAVEKLVGAAKFTNELTNPNTLTVEYSSNNTDVATVDAASGEVTIVAAGVAEITASTLGDETHKAGSAKYTVCVTAHAGTEADPYTVADAKIVIDALGTKEGVYAAGIICQVDAIDLTENFYATYWISADGLTTGQKLEAYHGKYLDNANFDAEDNILVGDEVVIFGNLKKFSSTYEFDGGNYLTSLNRTKVAAGLAYETASVEKNVGDEAFSNTLTNPYEVTVAYSSSAPSVASVNAETGLVTVNAMGEATITATFAGNDSYLPGSASYTVNVSDPSITKVTFDATVDMTASSEVLTLIKNGVTMEISKGQMHNGVSYRLNKDQTLTLSCEDGLITRIELEGTDPSYAVTNITAADYSNGVWTGSAESVDLVASVAQARMTKINVYYGADSREVAGLAYAVAAIEKNVGDANFTNELTNPNGVTVAYSSNDASVASVDAETGEVTIVAAGEAIITASFAGNATYKSANVSYTITVSPAVVPPTPSTGTTYRKVTATENITDGEYLIVYEATGVAFNGALETLDAEGNSVAVTINEGVIAGTTAIDAAVFTIDVTAGTLQSASGKYIGVSSNSNGLKQTENAETYTHTFSIDGEGNAVILANFTSSTMKLRYNPSTSAGNLRFRYYKNDGQQAIQLYKKEVLDWEDARTGLDKNRFYTVCLEKAITHVKGATFWSLANRNEAGTLAYLEEEVASELEPLPAGKPFIIRATDAKLEVVYEGATGSAGTNGALVGTFDDLDAAALNTINETGENDVYMLFNNELRPIGANNHLDAHRAYVLFNLLNPVSSEPKPAPGRRVLAMPMQKDVTTDIDALNASETPVKMMIDGQLFILRGEKLYDATGRLVK